MENKTRTSWYVVVHWAPPHLVNLNSIKLTRNGKESAVPVLRQFFCCDKMMKRMLECWLHWGDSANTTVGVPFQALLHMRHLNGIQEAVSSILSSSTRNLKGLRKATVDPFFVPMPFVPVLCQFLHGYEVNLRAVAGQFKAFSPSRTQVERERNESEKRSSGSRGFS